MESLRPRFAERGDRPLLMISLLDARDVPVFGENLPVPGGARSSLASKTPWHGEAAFWGSVSVGIDQAGGILS